MTDGPGSVPENLEPLITNIDRQVRAGVLPDDAARELRSIAPERAADVGAALAEYLRRVGLIRIMRDPPGMVDRSLTDWYLGPREDDRYWPLLRTALRYRGWQPDTIESIDTASTRILSLLPPPGRASFHSRGLVLGYVQSGKTANYTAVIAKAADVNYRLFIVLSGIHNALRSQTQERLESELCRLNSESWASLTTVADDFSIRAAGNADFFLTSLRDQRVLVVVKKNAAVLRRLIRWLTSANPRVLASCPILVIDDEADQASINASMSPGGRTRINELIGQLLTIPPRAAYVGYTATPFANLLIDPADAEGLYPRDFIVDLPKPDGYFGPERIFGRDRLTQEEGDEIDGLDVIREISDEDVPEVKPPTRDRGSWSPTLVDSLRNALDYFLLATSARRARGHTDLHSSMLIHTTMYTDGHEAFRPVVERWREARSGQIAGGDRESAAVLRDLWTAEVSRVPATEVGETATDFDALEPYLEAVLSELEVVVENSRSVIRLEYGDVGRPVVVIGGNTLSRGLTLRGLVVSYFVRSASAYDTLLQMGRWFGYRDGYADLPRVWMTAELAGYFFDLATVEHEIRQDVRLYELEGTTPTEFAVRIRTHPALTITARAKMQAAVECDISFSGRRPQMIFYRYRDIDWLRRNLDAGRRLVERAVSSGARVHEREDRAAHVLYGVAARDILDFVADYGFHPRNDQLQPGPLAGYIRDQNEIGELLTWNVAVVSRRRREGDRMIDVGPGVSVPLISRAKMAQNSDDTDAYLKAVMSHVDLAADMAMSVDEAANMNAEQLTTARVSGLLLLYPIDKDSQPRTAPNGRRSTRLPLDATEDLLGLAIVFPKASHLTAQGYRIADLSRIPREPLDMSEELEADGEEDEV